MSTHESRSQNPIVSHFKQRLLISPIIIFSLKLFRTSTTSEVFKVMRLSEAAIRIPEQITRWLHDAASEAPDLNQKGSSIQKSHRDFPPFNAVKQIAGNYAGSSLQNIQSVKLFRHSVRHNLCLSGSFLLDFRTFFAPPAKSFPGKQLITFWHLLPYFHKDWTSFSFWPFCQRVTLEMTK